MKIPHLPVRHAPRALRLILITACAASAANLFAQATRPATTPDTRPQSQAVERTSDRTSNRPSDRASERSFDRSRPQTQPASNAQSTGSVRPSDYNDRYAILTQKNIFLRNRSRGSSGSSSGRPTFGGSSTSDSPRTPEQSYTLTGIAIQDGHNVAYIEGGGTIQRVELGGNIVRGKVVAIELDYLEYESNGRRTRVDIGRNLAGGTSMSTAIAPTTQGSGTTLPALDPSDPSLTIEQRMKLRALRERGQ